jgi:hypothetical protein
MNVITVLVTILLYYDLCNLIIVTLITFNLINMIFKLRRFCNIVTLMVLLLLN